MLAGDAVVRCGSAAHALPAGSMMLVPAGTVHDLQCACAWRGACILFSDGLAEARSPLVIEGPEPRLRRRLHDLLACHQDGSAAEASALLAATLAGIMRRGRPSSEAMHPALDLLLSAIAGDPTLAADAGLLARLSGVGTSRLRSLCHARFGCGPVRYIHRRRLATAQLMLSDAALPVREIARRCGYADPNHFARRFRAEHGFSPSAFRRLRGLASGDAMRHQSATRPQQAG